MEENIVERNVVEDDAENIEENRTENVKDVPKDSDNLESLLDVTDPNNVYVI